VVNALMAEIDGVEGREGVVLLAACNHQEKLDPALVRSWRLDRHVRMHLPDQAALVLILGEHLGADLADDSLAGAGRRQRCRLRALRPRWAPAGA
jgi:SpoVK/Ycf46/Vps4 family AAA+-type ATPase